MKTVFIVGASLWLGLGVALSGETEAPGPEPVELGGVAGEKGAGDAVGGDADGGGEEMNAAIVDGFGWLMAAQAADGGWHSSTYGAMRGGAGLTGLVLYTASLLPEEVVEPHAESLRKGWKFLAPGLRGSGMVSAPDGETDFPGYGAGLLLCALNRLDLGQSPEDVEMLVVYLCRTQLDEEHGFEPGDPDYGGWDLMGDDKREGKTTGSNISVSRFAIEGLEPHRKREDVSAAIADARRWIGGVQNREGDGGFYFHPEGRHLGNKAGWSDVAQEVPRSYGTSTADGLVALAHLAAGAADGEFSEQMKAAAGWLEKESEVGKVPGFAFDPPEKGWEEGLRYYYVMALSVALPLLSEEVSAERKRQIGAFLLGEQSDEGGWKNPSARMREDDPIVATCFALAALGCLAER